MLVRELQDALAKFDSNLEVFAYTQDESLLGKGHIFRLLDVEYVDTAEGEMVRGDDNVPSMRFGTSETSRKIVTLGVTGTF